MGPEKEAAAGTLFNRIHTKNIFFCVEALAGGEPQGQVDDKGENDRADDANGRALGVDGDRCERSGGKRDNGDDDGCLSDGLCFYFEGEFHVLSQRRRGQNNKWARRREGVKALA